MAQLTIQNLDEALMVQLKARAQAEGVSVEAAARGILAAAFARKPASGLDLALSIQQRFAGLGEFEIPVVEREPMREVLGFENKNSKNCFSC